MSAVVSLKVLSRSEKWVKKHPTTVRVDIRRKLKAGEIAMAQLIFKDSIDYSSVEIIRGGLLSMPDSSKNAMTPFGSIHLPHENYEKISDFSKASDATDKIWFIHEMAHVWQYSIGLSVAFRGVEIGLRGGYKDARAYDYDLNGKDKNKTFTEFNFEQQAELISHYFDAVHLSIDNHNYIKLHRKNLNNLSMIKSILKDFIDSPKNRNLISKNYGEIYHGK